MKNETEKDKYIVETTLSYKQFKPAIDEYEELVRTIGIRDEFVVNILKNLKNDKIRIGIWNLINETILEKHRGKPSGHSDDRVFFKYDSDTLYELNVVAYHLNSLENCIVKVNEPIFGFNHIVIPTKKLYFFKEGEFEKVCGNFIVFTQEEFEELLIDEPAIIAERENE